jgi:hypothetical protein
MVKQTDYPMWLRACAFLVMCGIYVVLPASLGLGAGARWLIKRHN